MKNIFYIFILILFLAFPKLSLALTYGDECTKSSDCPADSVCHVSKSVPERALCSQILPTPMSIFGKVKPPGPLEELGIGSIGISGFVNALIRLIYMLAAVIFVFMLLWGAIEWLMSGGDKEKVQSAGKRLTNAIIGIVLLAVTFAILNLIGIFTGFTFFT